MKPPSSKAGSALLLTLLVVGLMLMVVLSFSVYVRMEVRSVRDRQAEHQARANALLALDLALDQLQRAAGPDSRATATARSLGNAVHPDYQHLTGVWDTRPGRENQPPVWLVSTPTGSAPVLTSPLPAASITLVDTGTLGASAPAHLRVRAPTIPLRGPEGDVAGNLAWWTADESVKASFALDTAEESAGEDMIQPRHSVPVRSAAERSMGFHHDPESPLARSLLRRLVSRRDLGFVAQPVAAAGFHDFTPNARGLLTRPRGGGVKTDLSLAPAQLGAAFARYINFPAYTRKPFAGEDPRRAHVLTPPSSLEPADGEIVHSVAPVITDFGLQFSPHRNSSTNGQAMISMRFVLELWNPYTSAIPAEDMVMEIRGLKPVTMRVGLNWEHTFDLAATFGDPLVIRLDRRQRHSSPNPAIPPDSYDARFHGPGRVLYWIGPASLPAVASFGTNNSTGARLILPAIPSVTFPNDTNLPVRYRMEPTSLTVTLRRAPENGGEILVQHRAFEYEEVDTGDVGTLGLWQQRWLTYRFRMIERGTTYIGDRSAWLKHADKRAPNPRFGDDATRHTHTMHEAATGYSPWDDMLRNDLNLRQDQNVFYFDRVMSTSAWSRDSRRDLPLFELPRAPLLSIGQLQHLHIAGLPPYAIGNPWGGERWNRLFDEHFFSGIQSGISMPDFSREPPQPPHPRLSFAPAAELGLARLDENTLTSLGANSAVALRIEGAFNLNSVSAEAWTAVLGGALLRDLRHLRRDTNFYDSLDEGGAVTSAVNYPAGFARFPQSLAELFDVDVVAMDRASTVSPPQNDRVIRSLKLLVPFLHPRVGFAGSDADYRESDDGLLRELGAAIAEAVRTRVAARGRPFFSLDEFISGEHRGGQPLLESLLRGDVDAARFPRIHAGELRRLRLPVNGSPQNVTPDERGPAWLSQADILSALSPFLTTRGDTFLIRAYGDVTDPSGNRSSRAWAEAVVQRVITPVEPVANAAAMAAEPPGPQGRRLQLLSLKWLDASDI